MLENSSIMYHQSYLKNFNQIYCKFEMGILIYALMQCWNVQFCTRLLVLKVTATMTTKWGLIKSCLGSICLLAVSLIWLRVSPLNLTAPSVSVYCGLSGGRGALRDTVRSVTRALTTGVTRGSSHFTEVQESHKASGGIYEAGEKAKGVGGGQRMRDKLGCCWCLHPIKKQLFLRHKK